MQRRRRARGPVLPDKRYSEGESCIVNEEGEFLILNELTCEADDDSLIEYESKLIIVYCPICARPLTPIAK